MQTMQLNGLVTRSLVVIRRHFGHAVIKKRSALRGALRGTLRGGCRQKQGRPSVGNHQAQSMTNKNPTGDQRVGVCKQTFRLIDSTLIDPTINPKQADDKPSRDQLRRP
jgi:hypothetical protein